MPETLENDPGEVDSSVDIVAYGTKYSSSPFQVYFCLSSTSCSNVKFVKIIYPKPNPNSNEVIEPKPKNEPKSHYSACEHFLRSHSLSDFELFPGYFSDFLHYYESFSLNHESFFRRILLGAPLYPSMTHFPN